MIYSQDLMSVLVYDLKKQRNYIEETDNFCGFLLLLSVCNQKKKKKSLHLKIVFIKAIKRNHTLSLILCESALATKQMAAGMYYPRGHMHHNL